MCGGFTGEHEVKIIIYSKPNCPYCTRAKALAEMKGADTTYLMLGEDFNAQEFMAEFPTARTFPQIILDNEKIGGYTDLDKALNG